MSRRNDSASDMLHKSTLGYVYLTTAQVLVMWVSTAINQFG